MANEMRGSCGERADPKTMATVLYNTMDHSCITELATATVGKPGNENKVDVSQYLELTEYMLSRQAREQILQPQAPVKMDVSGVDMSADAAGAPVPPPPIADPSWSRYLIVDLVIV